MKKIIVIYSMREVDGHSEWPEELTIRFQKNCHAGSQYFFDKGSELKKEFCDLCDAHNVVTEERFLAKVYASELKKRGFVYLSVQEDRNYETQLPNSYLNYFSHCNDVGESCKTLYDCIDTFHFDLKKSKKLDIATLPYRFSPRFFLASKRFLEVAEKHRFSGVVFIPLQGGDWYWMKICTDTVRPPRSGLVSVNEENRCRVCGRLHFFSSDIPDAPWFANRDFSDCDFQYYSHIETTNLGVVEISEWKYLISHRALSILVDEKISGIRPYFSALGIRYCAPNMRKV